MSRSLVACLVAAIAAGSAAAVAALAAGWGPLAAFVLYSGVGSCALVASALLAAWAPRPAVAGEQRALAWVRARSG